MLKVEVEYTTKKKIIINMTSGEYLKNRADMTELKSKLSDLENVDFNYISINEYCVIDGMIEYKRNS